jgi:Flp pilus assembly protein TadG
MAPKSMFGGRHVQRILSSLFQPCKRGMCLARDGNVAIIFALALPPIFAFIGAAIDYSRVNMARSAMQSALD